MRGAERRYAQLLLDLEGGKLGGGDIQREGRGAGAYTSRSRDAAGRASRGIEQLRIRRADGENADPICRIAGGTEIAIAAGGFKQVLAIEIGRTTGAEQRLTLRGNIRLDLVQIGAEAVTNSFLFTSMTEMVLSSAEHLE
jgi:hypothetical protein